MSRHLIPKLTARPRSTLSLTMSSAPSSEPALLLRLVHRLWQYSGHWLEPSPCQAKPRSVPNDRDDRAGLQALPGHCLHAPLLAESGPLAPILEASHGRVKPRHDVWARSEGVVPHSVGPQTTQRR